MTAVFKTGTIYVVYRIVTSKVLLDEVQQMAAHVFHSCHSKQCLFKLLQTTPHYNKKDSRDDTRCQAFSSGKNRATLVMSSNVG